MQKKSRDLEKAESRLKSQDEKIADYELRVSNLMHEKEKIAEDIRGIEREVERIVIEKGEVDYELKESRFQACTSQCVLGMHGVVFFWQCFGSLVAF